MACSSETITRRVRVWSQRSTTGLFIPLHDGSAMTYALFKVDYNLQESRGTIELKRAVRYSNDGGFTWSTPTELGSYSSTEGWDHDPDFHSLSDDYSVFQLGLLARNDSGTDQRIGWVDVEIGLAASARQ